MEMLLFFVAIALMAFFCEYIDSSLGMGYGTILSPVLIIMGFDPLVVVPAILFSQAMGGFIAAAFHHEFKNVDFGTQTKDSRIVYIITVFGIIATIIAVQIAVNIPKQVLKTYIGFLVLVMGLLLLTRRTFRFSWAKIVGIGVLSAFNKGLTGGGFGPVVTSGQIIAGHRHKAAIGITTLTEAPICITGFLLYMLTKGTANWRLITALTMGAALVAPLGAFTTRKIPVKNLKYILGGLIAILGIWILVKTWL
jgi:uncharacterized membrane protein YfcA